ncbi:hypothetical protein PGTUg99_029190 [Puccinia graminis f. sp. tritici]|uniref:Uncharacterized protein n=1 Tax=Puccinia graminis f. sp. tritici TaxID=56615 RepID=A0A5B0SN49_PUCGR|nr:hypothetical protein PGTUg99_029190 [Puccinia graminis f. sp. tritici]
MGVFLKVLIASLVLLQGAVMVSSIPVNLEENAKSLPRYVPDPDPKGTGEVIFRGVSSTPRTRFFQTAAVSSMGLYAFHPEFLAQYDTVFSILFGVLLLLLKSLLYTSPNKFISICSCLYHQNPTERVY